MGEMTLTSGEAPDESAVKGKWEPIDYRCGFNPIHVALLHTGKVLSFGGSCNNEELLKTPRPAELWDPETNDCELIEQDLDGDVFCVGHAYLPDGRLLIAGGTAEYDVPRRIFGWHFSFPPFRGLEHTYIFDPNTKRWTREGDLAFARWYPTLIMLGDGRVVAIAGFTRHFPWVALRKIEIFSPGTGWQVLKGADRWMPLYPRLHLLPDGRIFYSGSYNTHYTFPFDLKQFPTSILDPDTGKWDGLGLPNQSEREEGTTVLLPLYPPDYRPRVLLVGGGTPRGKYAVANCEMIDLSEARPRWQKIESMKHPRYYVYPVILPDSKILVLGGRTGSIGHDMPHPDDPMSLLDQADLHPGPHPGEAPHDERAVLHPELFDPETGHWTEMAPMTVDRLYHANALLLPDGRVAAIGSNPKRRVEELRIEIYQPPYLFRGPRPTLRSVAENATYGQEFEIDSLDAKDIDTVVLIHPTATTHCLNPEQRFIRLEFRHAGDETLVARIPLNRNVVPPGYYMLFLLCDGVPSKAKFIRVS